LGGVLPSGESWVFAVPPNWHGITEIDFFVKHIYNIHDQGTIRPLASLPAMDPCILFEAGGEYYYINFCNDFLVRHGSDFASPDDFLRRREEFEGVTEELPADANQRWQGGP
jgi:hypothetical protein